ncbi:MAG: diguanylate cyclase, partial [Acidobacteria bacterium]|nr:diguanylate cyclase [Acidobacteriota bacterium]
VVLPDTPANGAMNVARKVVEAVRALDLSHEKSEAGDRVSVSVGVATVVPRPTLGPEHLIELADRGLFRAKKDGGDRIAEPDSGSGQPLGEPRP